MELGDKVRKRFNELINTADRLKHGNEHGQVHSEEHRQQCIAWSASAQNIVHLVVNNPGNPYRASVDKSCTTDRGYCAQETVGEVSLILKSILKEGGIHLALVVV